MTNRLQPDAQLRRPFSKPVPLKVLHVVLSLDVGGLERLVLDLVAEGRQRGHDVDVLCLERPGLLAPQGRDLGARVYCTHKEAGVRPAVLGRVKDVLARVGPDVVHTHQIGALFYTGAAATVLRVPAVVHTEHGKQTGDRLRTRLLGCLAACYAAKFFCVSHDIAAQVQTCYMVPRRKIAVVSNGIPPSRFHTPGDDQTLRRSLGIPPGAPVVGTVGRLTEVKRPDLLVRTFARLPNTDTHLVFVGDGPLLPELVHLVAVLGLQGRVHFAGYQAQPERYLQLFRVFALTSRSEGMPLAVLEAWAASVPVVATRVGGLPEVVEDGSDGRLVAPHDEAALARALEELLADPEAARRMGAAGRHKAETVFSVQRTAETYERHYLRLLALAGWRPRATPVGAAAVPVEGLDPCASWR